MGQATCSTCLFCYYGASASQCRFMIPAGSFGSGWTWPEVNPDDWCGKHPGIHLETLTRQVTQALLDGDTPEDQALPPALPPGQNKPDSLEGGPRLPVNPEDAPTMDSLIDLWHEVASLHRHTHEVGWAGKRVQINPASAGRAWIAVWDKIGRCLKKMEAEVDYAGAMGVLLGPTDEDPATPENDGA